MEKPWIIARNPYTSKGFRSVWQTGLEAGKEGKLSTDNPYPLTPQRGRYKGWSWEKIWSNGWLWGKRVSAGMAMEEAKDGNK